MDENPTLMRRAATRCAEQHGGRLIGIGGSHVSRIFKNVKVEKIDFTPPGFMPRAAGISESVLKTKRLTVTPPDLVVADLLSNSTFVGSDPNGIPPPPRQKKDWMVPIM